MFDLNVKLFGKMEVLSDNDQILDLNVRRAQELLAYILLSHKKSHLREILAEKLWPHSKGGQTMKYLRNTLWQLRNILGIDLLLHDSLWICLNPDITLWVDVSTFNRIAASINRKANPELSRDEILLAEKALDLYRGELLEGFYHDWCLVERDKLQNQYLYLLDKLLADCESRGAYEEGLIYGAIALKCDMSHERIHRRLIRLHYQAGNRGAALRQFEICASYLKDKLNIYPSTRTMQLINSICQDNVVPNESTTRNSVRSYSLQQDLISELQLSLSILDKKLPLLETLLKDLRENQKKLI